MIDEPDPLQNHPELRGRIKDPLQSFFRTFNARAMFERRPELHWVIDKLHSDEVRQASRLATLATHTEGDLWVFAYGSLMWDPALVFAEVRRAVVPDYARRFILKDEWGGRGTRDMPGLMAALDAGEGCQGLVFRIARDRIDTETEILWRREMIAPSYLPRFVTALVDDQPLPALTFVADYTAETMQPTLSYADQVRFCATGSGVLGTSHDYLKNIVQQFATLGVVDEHCTTLLRDVEDYRQANPATTR